MNADSVKAGDFTYIDWETLRGKTIFLTGVTGLVGFSVYKLLNLAEKEFDLGLRLVCLVRSRERAQHRLSGVGDIFLKVEYIEGSVTDEIPLVQSGSINYVIHCAGDSASRSFVDNPVSVMKTAIDGTINVLEFAKSVEVSGAVYISSMEVYGAVEKGVVLTEQMAGTFSPMNPRDSYPIAKIACEALCHSYAKEHGLPVKAIRLSQVFGKEYSESDTRFPAMLMRCAKEKKDIVLKTKGLSERCYIGSLDAAGAIFLILLKGNPGEIYNAADEETYGSVAEMAEKIAGENGIKVVYDLIPQSESAFPQDSYLHLETQKLKGLGWKRVVGI